MTYDIQNIVCDALDKLQEAAREGQFGVGDRFDRDRFEAAFDDEVLVLAYVYEREGQKGE